MYVLEEALGQADAWRRAGLDLKVAVNLSARSLLDRSLAADLTRLLRTWDVPPGTLEVELTESSLMADPHRVREVLDLLCGLGVGIAIDDFGTGWSSLGRLSDLPIDELKIDRSFVRGMTRRRADATLVRSTIDLGRNLGMRVVAEGVEDEDVRRRLALLGCDLGQGYLFSPPLDGGELHAWATTRPALARAA
jgi:EAL domain-containing protein (putative c-di-GMP-specific phosphodiesterase class I)